MRRWSFWLSYSGLYLDACSARRLHATGERCNATRKWLRLIATCSYASVMSDRNPIQQSLRPTRSRNCGNSAGQYAASSGMTISTLRQPSEINSSAFLMAGARIRSLAERA